MKRFKVVAAFVALSLFAGMTVVAAPKAVQKKELQKKPAEKSATSKKKMAVKKTYTNREEMKISAFSDGFGSAESWSSYVPPDDGIGDSAPPPNPSMRGYQREQDSWYAGSSYFSTGKKLPSKAEIYELVKDLDTQYD